MHLLLQTGSWVEEAHDKAHRKSKGMTRQICLVSKYHVSWNYFILLTASSWCLVLNLNVFIFKLFSSNKKLILIETKTSYSHKLRSESKLEKILIFEEVPLMDFFEFLVQKVHKGLKTCGRNKKIIFPVGKLNSEITLENPEK